LFSWPAAAQRVVLFNALPEFSHRETERLSPEFFKNFSIFSGIQIFLIFEIQFVYIEHILAVTHPVRLGTFHL
jgi:hypothetical protein